MPDTRFAHIIVVQIEIIFVKGMKTGATYFKAVLLIIVFSMNSVISNACSLSNYIHKAHHHAGKSEHHHSDGTNEHGHDGDHEHHGSEEDDPAHDCCSAYAATLNQRDKALSRNIETAAFCCATHALYSHPITFNLPSAPTNIGVSHFARWRYPETIQDLRIEIQSFQI